MKKLAVITDHHSDTSSFYRVLGPLSRLREVMDFDIPDLRHANWPSIAMCDAVFLHRPYKLDHLEVIHLAKKLKKPIWVDMDDDLLCVPEDNFCHAMYSNEDAKRVMIESMQLADVLSIQGDELKNRYAQFNKNIVDVPNAFDEKILGPLRNDKVSDEKIVLWRGTATHMKDVYHFKDEIISVMKKHPEWTLMFMGMHPFFIFDELPKEQCAFISPLGLMDYFNILSQINPKIMIVPLHDNPFNRVKSCIAWMEGTMAGAAVLTPDWDQWTGNPMKYTDKKQFSVLLDGLLDQSTYLKTLNNDSWEWITGISTLGEINNKRKQLLESLW